MAPPPFSTASNQIVACPGTLDKRLVQSKVSCHPLYRMIISASRRTDIPAFYGEWLLRRFEEGFCEVPNPFNPRQISRISLLPEDLDALVLWTRYPRTLLQGLPTILERGIPVAALYTIVDYPRELEPALPPLRRRIDAFRRLTELLGVGAVVWRYDPILLSNRTPEQFHLDRFGAIATELRGLGDRVIVSLLQEYRSVARQLAEIPDFRVDADAPRARQLVADLAELAQGAGFALQPCADPRLEGLPDLASGGCIDERLLRAAGVAGKLPGEDPNQRGACRCLRSRDIGSYETCLFGCRYCYASHGIRRARENRRRHDPAAPQLLGPA